MSGFIAIKNLTVTFPCPHGEAPRRALDGVSLEIERGSLVAVVGRNGSGKTTLARSLNALQRPTAGTVTVNGMDTADPAHTVAIRRTVGLVFQQPDHQLVSPIVEDDVAFGPENLGLPPAQIRRRVDEALSRTGLYEQRQRATHLLSGGQRQRVAIAGVLAMRPECMVLDEPTAMLDPQGRRMLMALIADLHRQGVTVLLITHDMEQARRAQRILVLERGRLYADAPPEELLTDRAALEALGLELPLAAELAGNLRTRGLDLPPGIIDRKAMVEALCPS